MAAKINGVSLHYIETGPRSALPVVFLHGFPFSHEMWAGQIEAVRGFCRAVAFDMRGFGSSEMGDLPVTLEDHVDDLIALMDHLGIEKGAVVGLSMGGYVALRALERNPGRFLAAVLCDTRSEADSNEGRLKRAAAIRAIRERGVAPFAEGFLKAVFGAESFQKRPGTIDRLRRVIERTSPAAMTGTLLALAARTDTTGSLENIGVPTLILVGEKDVTTPPSASEAMRGKIPRSEIFVIPGAAHMSNLENPEVFNNHLVNFLRRVDTQRRKP